MFLSLESDKKKKRCLCTLFPMYGIFGLGHYPSLPMVMSSLPYATESVNPMELESMICIITVYGHFFVQPNGPMEY